MTDDRKTVFGRANRHAKSALSHVQKAIEGTRRLTGASSKATDANDEFGSAASCIEAGLRELNREVESRNDAERIRAEIERARDALDRARSATRRYMGRNPDPGEKERAHGELTAITHHVEEAQRGLTSLNNWLESNEQKKQEERRRKVNEESDDTDKATPRGLPLPPCT